MVWPMDKERDMGTSLHSLGWALGQAMIADRVLIYQPDKEWFYASANECGAENASPNCFFLPLSTCQVRK